MALKEMEVESVERVEMSVWSIANVVMKLLVP